MTLPQLAQYPPETLRQHLPPEEWQACLDAWILNVQLRLRLTDSAFSNLTADDAGVPFVLSYLARNPGVAVHIVPASKEATLRHHSYFLLKRILLVSKAELSSTTLFQLLGGASLLFASISDWKRTLAALWKSKQAQIKKATESEKTALFSSGASTERLDRLTALLRCLPDLAVMIMAGADLLEELMAAYDRGKVDVQRAATANVYYSFLGLTSTKHTPLLLDNLYHMKSEVERSEKSQLQSSTLLSSLVCTTSFLRHLRSNSEMARRQQGMVDFLSSYQLNTLHLHPPSQRIHRKRSKGKQKLTQSEEMHIHQAGQISQVHDLFPDLSAAYILKLLDYFQDNVENVIAALLEPNSLPAQLQDYNVTEVTGEHHEIPQEDLAPRSTPPLLPQRKNVFDDDDFDRLQISTTAIRRGKKTMSLEQHRDSGEHARSKAAIMTALASFDADDDERDDSYDVADVGGAVDNTVDTDERSSGLEKNEEVLFRAWKDNPEMFARDSKTRVSTVRSQLKRDTGMTDEQIEGWAAMLKRDPKMEIRLQSKYAAERAFRGNQGALESTRWAARTSTENTDAESGAETSGTDSRRMGQASIRGHRQFNRGRGRGGSTSGPSDAADTQAARRRKEQGRGRGNHQRREGRAKKMGRGMGGLAA